MHLSSYLLILVAGLAVMLKNSRENVHAELDSTSNLALHLLNTAIIYFSSGVAANAWTDTPFRRSAPGRGRHLCVEYFDAHRSLRDSNRAANAPTESKPPAWFGECPTLETA
jgi:two-component system sensor histidine kinase UhpB